MIDILIVFLGEYFGHILLAGLLVFLLSRFAGSRKAGKDWKKHISLVLQMIVATILSRGIITETVRFFWHRARPFVEQNFVSLIPHANSASFPSGHATFFFAIGTVLYLYNKKAGIVFLAGSALVGIARVLAGLHWSSDVAVGAAIGIVCGWLVSRYVKIQ